MCIMFCYSGNGLFYTTPYSLETLPSGFSFRNKSICIRVTTHLFAYEYEQIIIARYTSYGIQQELALEAFVRAEFSNNGVRYRTVCVILIYSFKKAFISTWSLALFFSKLSRTRHLSRKRYFFIHSKRIFETVIS